MKTRLDHSNYEAWLLDRLEGRLTPEEEVELQVFLLAHPHLPVADDLPTVDGPAERMAIFDKEGLKRTLPPQGLIDEGSLDDYLIARLEGELGPAQLAALERHLSLYPEHLRQGRLVAAARIARDHVAFPGTDALKRSIPPLGLVSRHTLTDHLIARLEGDLEPEQERALDGFLHMHPSAGAEWAAVQRTKVVPEAMRFEEKAGLKREPKVVPLISAVVMRWAAAAAVILALTAWWFRDSDPPQMAHVPKTVALPSATAHEPVQVRSEDAAPDASVGKEQEAPVMRRGSVQGVVPETKPKAPEMTQEPVMEEAPMALRDDLDEQLHDPIPDASWVAQANEPMAGGAPAAARTVPRISEPPSIGEALAGVLRERVLDRSSEEQRALDAADAVAAVDRGLKAVGGGHSGLSVKRDDQGRQRGFSLRLGRNLAFTASR